MIMYNGSDSRLERHEQILEKLVEQQIRTEELLKATIGLQKDNTSEIKDLRKESVDVGKILDKMVWKFNIVQWIIVAVLAAVISQIVPHIIK